MERLHGESIDEESPPTSDCSPSNLKRSQRHEFTFDLRPYMKCQNIEDSNSRDSILSKGQILDQNIQPSVLFIQEFSNPPVLKDRDR